MGPGAVGTENARIRTAAGAKTLVDGKGANNAAQPQSEAPYLGLWGRLIQTLRAPRKAPRARRKRGRCRISSMTEFDDRERAEETKFQVEQELEFKAQARRAKLVGKWAAGLIGLSEAGA